LTTEFLDNYPQSSSTVEALTIGSQLAAADADTAAAAGYLVRLSEETLSEQTRQDATREAEEYLPKLTAAELTDLTHAYPRSALRPYMSFLLTKKLLMAGNEEEAGRAVQDLRDVFPEGEWVEKSEQLLVAVGTMPMGPGQHLPAAQIIPTQVGILCPLTGRFAVLGNAFYEGALLALAEINNRGEQQFELKVEDTAGDPVAAALAARRFATEQGSIAIVGAMMSDPTVAAALVADVYGIPLVSPTATNARIWEIGPGIFQTNLTGYYEVDLLAQLTTQLLLKERFAILYPSTPEGTGSYQGFAEAVRGYGGTVVGVASFSPEATDFRDAILELIPARPEVVFIHASVDQMILLGPQLDFYKMRALVLGLSNWNSPRLFRAVGAGLEQALFPSDTALFPADWTHQFHAAWQPEHAPPEATPVALKAYQATMLILDSLVSEEIETRGALMAALRQRLEVHQLDAAGPEAYANVVRMHHNGEIVPFPSEMFTATWVARVDTSAATATSDSLTITPGPQSPYLPGEGVDDEAGDADTGSSGT
jgi:branched-chain amino acid transport system substrate-binding protein